MNYVRDFHRGDRVETHPATDRWMMGDRYGTVVHTGRKSVSVKLDRSGHTRHFRPNDLIHRGRR